MTSRPIAPSPVATALLSVAERMADGTMDIGGRTLDVRRGAAVGISATDGDMELEDFLERSARLTKSQAAAIREARDEGKRVLPLIREIVTPNVIRHAMSRLWVERLAHGIAVEEDAFRAPPRFVPASPPWDGESEVPLLPLVLEALAHRASAGDAEAVGQRADQHFAWETSPHREAAERWCDLGRLPEPPVVSMILSRTPAGAPRVAALVRAGLAHLLPVELRLPPPPRRPPSIPPPSRSAPITIPPPVVQRPTDPESSTPTVAPPPSLLPAPRGPDISLSPGTSNVGAPAKVAGSLPPPNLTITPLLDPLDELDRLIATLEQTRAPGPERAKAWREMARIFDASFGALGEAARAYREAAAADPDDRVAQREAALRCASLGMFDVARAYAQAGTLLARTGKEQAAAWKRIAQLALWERDMDACTAALEGAVLADPADASLHQRLWTVSLADGRLEDAVKYARLAAERLHAVEPSRARAMLAWAVDNQPEDPDLATEYALAIAYDGYIDGAIAVLTRALIQIEGADAAPDAFWERAKAAIGELRPAPGTPQRRRTIADAQRNAAREQVLDAVRVEVAGDVDKAIALARAALDVDPEQALALLLLYDYRDRLPPDVVRTTVQALRRVVGDHLSLLAEVGQVARVHNDTALYQEVIEARFALAPFDAGIALMRLTMRTAQSDAASLRAALRDALAVDRFDHADATRNALTRLRELGDDVMDLGLRAVERLGHRDHALLDWIVAQSETDARPQMRVLALEHAVARSKPPDAARYLLALARHFREASGGEGYQRAAEARTLVRVLAVAPYHPTALERLTEIYSECGEGQRLMAVLALRLEAASDPDERTSRLRDMAACALHFQGDRARALQFVQAIIDEAGNDETRLAFGIRALVALHQPADVVNLLAGLAMDRDDQGAAPLWIHAVAIAEREAEDAQLALRTAIKGLAQSPQCAPLLLAFERLALELREVETARNVYRSLMDRAMGMHGRRALAYREARWLERAGDARAALEAYTQAFSLAPSAGVVFGAIERLAQTEGHWENLIAACMTLAQQSRDVDTRIGHVSRAAGLCERELGMPRRAFDLYLSTWRETGQRSLKENALRLARAVAAHSPADGSEVYSQLIAVLRERADKAWDAEEKVATLREIARIYALDCDAPDLAAAATEDAVDAATVDANLVGVRADMLTDLAEWLADRPGRKEDATARLRRALTLVPEHPAAVALLDRLRSRHSETSMAGPFPIKRPSFIPVAPTAEPEGFDALRQRVAAGDLDAGLTLSDSLVTYGRLEEGHRLLLSVVRREPDRVDAIRKLHALSRSAQVPAVEGVTGEILAMFDPALPTHPVRAVFNQPGLFTPYDTRLRDRTRVLRLLWEHAGARFRVERADLGIVGTDRVAPLGKSPLAVAFVEATRLLELKDEVELYTRRHENHGLFIASTKPPSVLVNVARGRDDLEDADAVRFRVGRAVELCRPEHILLATRTGREGQMLLAAITAAFGPTDGGDSTRGLDTEATAFGADLWQTLPGPVQQEITDILTGLDGPLDHDAMELSLRCRAACAGLAVCGRIAPSIRGLAADDPSLTGFTITTETEFVRACHLSKPLRALLRYALSDEYLAAHAQSA